MCGTSVLTLAPSSLHKRVEIGASVLTRARTDLNRRPRSPDPPPREDPEDAGIKLSSVATDIMGQSSWAVLEALIDGKIDPAAMADLAKRRMRSKIPALTEALTGRFTAHTVI